MKLKFILTTILVATNLLTMKAQDTATAADAPARRPFTLDDLIPGGSTYYEHSVPETKYLTWWGDICIDRCLDRCSTVDTKTGALQTLFTLDDIAGALSAASLPAVRHLYTLTFPYADRPLALVELPRHRALVDWTQRRVVWSQQRQPDTAAASDEDWNATSRHLACVVDHNLYVVQANGTVHAVSTDGSHDLVYGESVHRDEFGITNGTFWSPDGEQLAFYRMDQSMVTDYPQVDLPTPFPADGSRIATVQPDKYPMAGETSHTVSIGIYSVSTQRTVWLQTGDSTDRYFTNIAWAPDGRTLYLIELNRDQNHALMQAYDATDGRHLGTLLEERNDRYVEPLHPIRFLPWDATRFIYQTRNRDGYNHLYLCQLTKDGCRVERCLTEGTYEVISLAGFDTTHRRIVCTANADDPIGCAAYSIDLKGKRRALGDTRGWHTIQLSASGTMLTDSWSWGGDLQHGRLIDLVVHDGTSLRLLTADDPWQQFDVPTMQVGTLKAADGTTDLYYRLVLPTDFDPTRRYPAIVYVYGGPHAHNVDASRHWGIRGWDVWMAQRGYVMFCIDNRGSEHRGLAFEQATFRQLGVEEMKDQLCGIDYLRSLPYVDADRIGVHGWSFGGYMTTSLMTTYPDVFKVGVAGGPVIDWRYYEVMYGERYMDTPQTNPQGYDSTSLLHKAGNLKGRLLLIYGGNDPTCVPQHTLSFIRASIDAGTHPDLFVYPGDGHNMMGTDRVHLHEHITRYFDDHLR